MAKKTTRGQKLNESQLRAYRERKAETIIAPRPALDPTDEAVARTRGTAAAASVSGWGNVAEEYRMIRGDIKRLLVITAGLLVLLIALWLVLA